MANKAVTLYRYCRTEDGWKHLPAAMSANGKVKPDTVIIAGNERKYPQGYYELRATENGKRVWKRIEGNATEALAAQKVAQKKAVAVAVAEAADVQVVTEGKRET